MQTWNDRLRIARESAGVPKAQLARRVGVSAPTVTDWESGKIRKIDAANLLAVCSVLGADPYALLKPRTMGGSARQTWNCWPKLPTGSKPACRSDRYRITHQPASAGFLRVSTIRLD